MAVRIAQLVVYPVTSCAGVSVQAADVVLHLVKPCARCSVVTVDQRRGTLTPRVLRTLAGYRSVDGKVLFGQNAVSDGPGRLAAKDPVEVAPKPA